jgi:predicted dienelactone hydrolase
VPKTDARRRLVAAMLGLPFGFASQGVCAALSSAGRAGQPSNGFDAVSAVPGGSTDVWLTDGPRGRRLGVRIRWPAIAQPSPLILYSPGLGSGLSNGQAWCAAWQQAGFLVMTLSHPHTNESLWDTRESSFSQNMARALDAKQYPARVADCRHVLDLALREAGLAKWIDPRRIGAAGHSYGALTVQALVGQAGAGQRDERIRAAIALSPGALSRDSAARMKAVKLPFLSVTGSHDGRVEFIDGSQRIRLGIAVAQRHWVHEALPAGQRFLVSLHPADHMSFAGEIVNRPTVRFSRDVPESDAADRQIWDRVSAISTRFFQASLAAPGASGSAQSASMDAVALRDALRAQLGPEDQLKSDLPQGGSSSRPKDVSS